VVPRQCELAAALLQVGQKAATTLQADQSMKSATATREEVTAATREGAHAAD
jgi:hypothetical protein